MLRRYEGCSTFSGLGISWHIWSSRRWICSRESALIGRQDRSETQLCIIIAAVPLVLCSFQFCQRRLKWCRPCKWRARCCYLTWWWWHITYLHTQCTQPQSTLPYTHCAMITVTSYSIQTWLGFTFQSKQHFHHLANAEKGKFTEYIIMCLHVLHFCSQPYNTQPNTIKSKLKLASIHRPPLQFCAPSRLAEPRKYNHGCSDGCFGC